MALSTSVFSKQYWEYSTTGDYFGGRQFIQWNYLSNSENWEVEVQSAYMALTDHIIDASVSRDPEGLDWIYLEVPKIYSLLNLGNDDHKYFAKRLLIISDIAKLNDRRLSREYRTSIITAHNTIDYHFLSPSEYIFGCNSKFDFYVFETEDHLLAEETLISCLGNLSLYNTISPTQALSFAARIAYLRSVLRRNNGRDILIGTIDELLFGEYLQINSPIMADTLGVLAMASSLIDSSFTQTAYDFFKSQKDSMFIPKHSAHQVQAAHNYRLAKSGLPPQKEIAATDEQLDQFHAKIFAVTDSNYPLSNVGKLLESKTQLAGESWLDWLLDAKLSANDPSYKYDIGTILEGLTSNFNYGRNEGRTYLTHEKTPSEWEKFIFEALLNHIVKLSKNDNQRYYFDPDVSQDLFHMAFSISKTSDFSQRLSLSNDLYDYKLDSIAKIYLKLSRQLDLRFVELTEKLIDKSIAYHKRNYSYQPIEEIIRGKPGEDSYNFLLNYRQLSRAIEQQQKITNGAFSKAFQEVDIPIQVVQNSLGPNQIIVAYKHYREQIFRCLITAENLQCDVVENLNFLANKRELLKSIKAKKEVILDTNNLALSKAILSDINFSKTNEVFFHPPSTDFDLPFNVLLDHNSQYIGLRYKVSLLTSLIPRRVPTASKAVKAAGYFAVADPEYKQTKVVTANAEDFFKLRSAQQVNELQNLPSLTETLDEVRLVSDQFLGEDQKILTGENASEAKLRLTDFTNYDFLHFAVHGLVSGSFSGLREPALALSPPQEVRSSINDGLLTETEIKEFDFTDKLVFLSACQTASDYGSQINSGFDGLASSFLLAGAREILATQWSIESFSAVAIVSDYLNSYRKTLAIEGTLHKSLANYAKSTKSAPYFWAPYISFKSLEQVRQSTASRLELEVLQDSKYQDQTETEFNQIFKVGQKIYATGYQINLTEKKTQTVIFDISSGRENVLPVDKSVWRHVGTSTKTNKPILFGSIKNGEYVVPALFEFSENSLAAHKIFQLDKTYIPKATTLTVEALDFKDEHNFKMVIRGYISPTELEKEGGPEKNLAISKMPILVKYLNGVEQDPVHLPNSYKPMTLLHEFLGNGDDTYSMSLKYQFIDGKLYAFEEVDDFVADELYNARTGLYDCDPSRKFTRVYSVETANGLITPIMNVDGSITGQFVTEVCGGTEVLGIRRFDLESRNVSDYLPVTLGHPSVHSIQIQPDHTLHIGTLKIPASFDRARLDRIMQWDDWIFNSEVVLESSDQDLFFILSEKSGELSNVHLQLYRHTTVVMDAKLLDGDLYISGTFNQARSKIFKIPSVQLRRLH